LFVGLPNAHCDCLELRHFYVLLDLNMDATGVQGSELGETSSTAASSTNTLQRDDQQYSDPGEDDLDDLDGMPRN